MTGGGSQEPAAAAGKLTGQGKKAAKPRRQASPWRLPARAARRAAVAVVAVIVAGLAAATGTAHLNVVLLEIVAGVAVAEPVSRMMRRARPGSGSGDQPAAPAGRPARLITLPGRPGSRIAAIAGVIVIFVTGVLAGILSTAAGLQSLSCNAGDSHCEDVLGRAWEVLMPTQILIFITAMLGAVLARSVPQLARAVVLGAPVLAIVAYGHAIGPAGLPTAARSAQAPGRAVTAASGPATAGRGKTRPITASSHPHRCGPSGARRAACAGSWLLRDDLGAVRSSSRCRCRRGRDTGIGGDDDALRTADALPGAGRGRDQRGRDR
jgi:hypothetical protein